VLSAALLTAAAIATAACGRADGEANADAAQPAVSSYPRFDGSSAYELVRRQVAFGPRVPGSESHREMAAWVKEFLAERADTVIVQSFTHVTAAGDTLPLFNFLARFRPDATPSVLLLAHWDTRPISDQADDPSDRAKPVPGANDGASGTAILLELASMMRDSPPPRGVDLLLVDGEDYGDFGVDRDVFLGSRYFAANLPEGFEPEFGVLLDMVGARNLELKVEGHSNNLAPEVVDRVWNIAHNMGFGDTFRWSIGTAITDDHLPLNDAGIPTIDIIAWPYDYWHTPDDTPDKVSASSLGVVGSVMTRLIYRGR
jgi:Zn-dependent M28 family amino/carboxypeptidase